MNTIKVDVQEYSLLYTLNLELLPYLHTIHTRGKKIIQDKLTEEESG
jgi:hypothetical protein